MGQIKEGSTCLHFNKVTKHEAIFDTIIVEEFSKIHPLSKGNRQIKNVKERLDEKE